MGKKKVVKKKKGFSILFTLMLIAGLTIAGGYFSYNLVMENERNTKDDIEVSINLDNGIYVEIPRGAGTEAIADILKEKGVIKSPLIFKLLSMFNGYDGTYQSGTHIVSDELKYDEIMQVLSSKPVSIKVMIPEGYNTKQIAASLIKNKLINNAESFYKAANTEKFSYKFLEELPVLPARGNRLEGYLFPDTYEFDVNAKPKDIIDTMLRNFDRKFKPEYYEKAEKMGMTLDKIIILASVIEREAVNADERSIIAGIFHNRLKSKDPSLRKLQSCATIQYIYYMKEGIIKEKILTEDTKVNHPYNTYQIEGLPPGPICNPGEDAIKAALFPEETDFLYFVARGDGTHEFSRTYSEHQAAMRKYEVR